MLRGIENNGNIRQSFYAVKNSIRIGTLVENVLLSLWVKGKSTRLNLESRIECSTHSIRLFFLPTGLRSSARGIQ